MQKLDWYILKKFLVTFLFCMLLFTVVAVAVDISEKTDDFVKSGLSSRQLFDQYYIGFIPHIWSLLFPLFVFIAVIFFTSKMATQSEIIAILSSGTPYFRLLRPYWVGGFLLATLWWVGNRYWIPKANMVRSAFQANYLETTLPRIFITVTVRLVIICAPIATPSWVFAITILFLNRRAGFFWSGSAAIGWCTILGQRVSYGIRSPKSGSSTVLPNAASTAWESA
jgi:hypothetical protein